MKVSVVIPLFNQERFIQRCITSIRNQTYTDIEIIVVDDGSTDNSKGIIEHNSISDRRIILIIQKNKGTLQARKTGIQESTGEAIITVDSDDYLKVDAISLLVTKMTETNADIVVADHCIHKNGRVINRKNEVPKSYDKKDALRFLLLGKISVHVWGRLYKRELLQSLNLPVEKAITEDVLTNFYLFSTYNIKFAKVDKPLYHYIIHRTNISRSNDPEAVEGFFREFDHALEIIGPKNRYDLVTEISYYRSKDWIVYCRKGGQLSNNRSFHSNFFNDHYFRAKHLLPWYLRLEMILFNMNLTIAKLLFPVMKFGANVTSFFRHKFIAIIPLTALPVKNG